MSQTFLKLVSLVLFVTGDIKLLIILFINYKSHLLLANENSLSLQVPHMKKLFNKHLIASSRVRETGQKLNVPTIFKAMIAFCGTNTLTIGN